MTFWEALSAGKIELSKFDDIRYNACDAPGYHRGDMGKGVPKTARIYSVYKTDGSMAYCQSRNAHGNLVDERIELMTLEAWTPPPARAESLYGRHRAAAIAKKSK